MPKGLTGLSGIQGVIVRDAQATPEERMGGPVNPAHGHWGEVASPYPWESSQMHAGSHGPYGAENELLGEFDWVLTPAGNLGEDPTADLQPQTRAAPWPKNVAQNGRVDPDAVAYQLEESQRIHSSGQGAGRKKLYSPTTEPHNDEWTSFAQDNPGHTELVAIPHQIAGATAGWGTRDRTQSLAGQNEYGFDTAHQHRRWATGSIPGNYMWMRPGGRPLVKSLAGPARLPLGNDSPFAGQDSGAAFDTQGAILTNVPGEYQAPPTPYVAPANVSDAPSDVEWF